MSGQRIWLWTIALIAIVAAVGYRLNMFHRPSAPRAAKVLFVTGGSGPYWQETVNGAKAAARECNVQLEVVLPPDNESLIEQTKILIHVDGSQVDGIALSPVNAESQTRLINQLARETNVVTYDSDAKLSDRQSHVGASNFAAGRACARVVNDAIPNGGKIAVLVANLTKENLVERKDGFEEGISSMVDQVQQSASRPKFVVVGYLQDNGSDEKCAENIRETLAAHPDLVGLVGMNARHGPILLKVLGELDKLGKIKLVTFDSPKETLDGIEAGHIYATIAQDPFKYGYEAVNILATLARGYAAQIPVVGRGSTYVGVEEIRKENLDDFRKRLRSRQDAAEARPERDTTKEEAA